MDKKHEAETLLHEMRRSVASVAKYYVDNHEGNHLNRKVFEQMVDVGLRKIADKAVSENGKGKYLGQKFWSTGAVEIYKKYNRNIKDCPKSGKIPHLRHEHTIPVSYITNHLFSNKEGLPLNDYIEQIERLSVVSIISSEEEATIKSEYKKNMPPDWDVNNGNLYVRYTEPCSRKEITKGKIEK